MFGQVSKEISDMSPLQRTRHEFQKQSYKLPCIINKDVKHELLSPRAKGGMNNTRYSHDVNVDPCIASLSLS